MSGFFGGQPFGGQQQPGGSAFGANKPSGAFTSALNTSTAPSQPSPFSWGTNSTNNPQLSTQPSSNPTGFGLGSLSGSNPTGLFQSQRPTINIGQTNTNANANINQQANNTLGWSTLQQSSANYQQVLTQPYRNVPVQNQNQSQLPVLNGPAKFNDLPTPLQDLLNDTESLLQTALNAAKDLKSRKLGDPIVANTATSRQIFHDLTSSTNTLQADDLFAKDLRRKTDQAVQDVIIATQIIDGFKESGIQHPNLKTNAQFPLEFFDRLAEQMQERLLRYKATADQLNRKLAFSFQAQQTPQAITATLQSQHASFIALAAKVAEIEASFDDVKVQFAELYKARTGSALNPFNRPPA